jgi:hypothetical protein
MIKAHPNDKVLFEANSPASYESIAATRRYLLYYGAPEAMYLRYVGGNENDSLYGALSTSMMSISEHGGDIHDDAWGFKPFKELPSEEGCLGVVFGEIKSVCPIYVNF